MDTTNHLRHIVSKPRFAVVIALLMLAPRPGLSQTEKVLYSFVGGTDGANPYYGNLVRDSKGNLYGTTLNGGAANYGTVFEVSPTGKEKLLHSFVGYPGDGSNPNSSLLRDSEGNLYGTTTGGGSGLPVNCGVYGLNGCGTVFEVTKSGTEIVLYNFELLSTFDGAIPYAGLVRDSKGNLYGTTNYGGMANEGTVFELAPTGAETVLYNFCSATGCADGAFPESTLFRDWRGNLYGTTADGGSGACTNGCGTVFKVTPTDTETVLHSFTGQPNDGANPRSGLVFDAKGNAYGTTNSGGAYNVGTVFRLTPRGKEIIYSFGSSASDGSGPVAAVALDRQGSIYGTTPTGGTDGYGTVFKIGTRGRETVLYSFTGGADGATPLGGLVLDGQGNLYGTTQYGGSSDCSGGCGVVFQLTP
ncbi:MAG: choice-of-anchor tandem repeat GloVer-containing protein [Candidatus Sulfotelmatobacter sp.]